MYVCMYACTMAGGNDACVRMRMHAHARPRMDKRMRAIVIIGGGA